MDNNALFKLSYGLYILTSTSNGIHNGCIINTAMQITSTAPFLITISINKGNFTTEQILDSGKFNLSILSESATYDTIKHFGFVSGRNINKFADISYKLANNGVPYIENNTSAYLSCNMLDKYDFDTHYLIKAIVTDGEILSTTSPTTYAYYHSNIKPQPQSVGSYICTICNYRYEGATLPHDFICPICKHGAADFIKS